MPLPQSLSRNGSLDMPSATLGCARLRKALTALKPIDAPLRSCNICWLPSPAAFQEISRDNWNFGQGGLDPNASA